MRELTAAWVVVVALLVAVAAAPVRALPEIDLAVFVNPRSAAKPLSAVEMETLFTR